MSLLNTNMKYSVAYVRMHVSNLDESVRIGVSLQLPILRRRGRIDVNWMARKSETLLIESTQECGIALHDLGSIVFEHGDDVATVMGDELRELHAQRQK